MNGTQDIEGAPPDDGDGFDPREAAQLLAQTERHARRQFRISLPWATTLTAAVGVTTYQRATAGVSGPSVRVTQFEAGAVLVSFLGSPVLLDAPNDGASAGIVYGVIPAAAPALNMVGTTVVGIAAVKENWTQFGTALVVVAAFVGQVLAWLAARIGMFIGVVVYPAITGQRPVLF